MYCRKWDICVPAFCEIYLRAQFVHFGTKVTVMQRIEPVRRLDDRELKLWSEEKNENKHVAYIITATLKKAAMEFAKYARMCLDEKSMKAKEKKAKYRRPTQENIADALLLGQIPWGEGMNRLAPFADRVRQVVKMISE